MPRIHEGQHDAGNKKVAIVAGRFNDFVTSRLVSSAVDCLVKHGVKDADVDVYWVPGAFEVPQLAMRIGAPASAGASGKVGGIVCLGTIIRGETYHFEILAASVINSISEIPVKCGIPVTYGIVNADSIEQAMSRAGGKNGNKGWDSALALVEMMALWGS